MSDAQSLAPADRLVMRILAGLTALAGALSVGFGAAHVVALANGDTDVELLATGELPGTPVDAAVTTALVSAADLTTTARGLLVAGTLVEALAGAVITIAIVALLLRISAGDPFHRSLFRMGIAAGFALLIGGMVGTGLRGLGQMEAAFGLNGDAGGPFEPAFTFDPGVSLLAFVVLALAMVFRVGARLQRETEGLV